MSCARMNYPGESNLPFINTFINLTMPLPGGHPVSHATHGRPHTVGHGVHIRGHYPHLMGHVVDTGGHDRVPGELLLTMEF